MTEDYQGPTPPQWQVDAWHKEALAMGADVDAILLKAYRAGADQELEACVEWVEREIGHGREWGAELRASRRSKPPSLAEEALAELEVLSNYAHDLDCSESAIRRALERLQELEGND